MPENLIITLAASTVTVYAEFVLCLAIVQTSGPLGFISFIKLPALLPNPSVSSRQTDVISYRYGIL